MLLSLLPCNKGFFTLGAGDRIDEDWLDLGIGLSCLCSDFGG